MCKKIFYLVLTSLLLVSCLNHNIESDNKDRIKENAENVFGIMFDSNHDWCITNAGELTINNIPSNIFKVQLLAYIYDENSDDKSLVVLNEDKTYGSSSVKLYYDAPKDAIDLYVAFIAEDVYEIRKVEGNVVSFSNAARTRSISMDYTLPTTDLKISVIEDSYAAIRGWVVGEKLYQMSDYSSQKMTVADYSDSFKEIFRTIIFSYFKNGRKYNNLPLVKESGYYNENVYPITTGDEPIILSPVYKNDGGYQEVVNSDLYYYYFKESEVGDDPVAYFESLPKYKAIQFDQCIKGDDVISKHAAYALIYWGDGIPDENTVGSYQFPEGYKIGFMVRAKTTAENCKKQGELYGDGRLNNYINNYSACNFKSSKLGTDGPRVAWMNVNGRMLLCCESGTDADFNDIIIEVEGGIEPFIPIPDIGDNYYTFCFEDREIGDYDMNDVVIKARRLNATQVEYSLVACGATDKLFIKNINGDVINDATEVHELFGAEGGFINTQSINYEPVIEVINVNSDFSFLDENTQPYIYDLSTGKEVRLSKQGEDPHGIMIPFDFKYPKERICIKNAYELFNNWGANKVVSTDWYKYPNDDMVL